MAIETNNLVIYKSEKLTDTADGGGKYSGQVVQDGISNNLFNDISELDRTMGDVSMRKVFAGVNSDDTDSLMGATVFIAENPQDPAVSALLFSTKSWTDTRDNAQNRVENYLAKGGQTVGIPMDTHWQGMKLLQVMMFPEEVENAVGDTIVLIANEGKANQFEQYVRITSVESRTAILVVNNNKVEYKIATYGLNDALLRDFVGLSPAQWYNGNPSPTILRETLVADTGKYYASVGLAANVAVNSTTVQAKSMFTQLIPAAQIETPMADLSVTGTSTALLGASANPISRTLWCNVGANTSSYIGSSILPSSLNFALDSNAITDTAGELKTASGTSVGTIEYDKGLIKWNSNSGSGSKNITFNFIPAAVRSRISNTDFIAVTQESQSLNYVRTLEPSPARGSVVINFTSQGKTYTLTDNGTGGLVGAISGSGTGTVDYISGTVLMTLSALPDVDTDIIIYWANQMAYTDIAERQSRQLAINYTLPSALDPTQAATIAWNDGQERSATIATDGTISGDAGGIAIGQNIVFKPNTLYALNTALSVSYTRFNNPHHNNGSVIANANGTQTIGGKAVKRFAFNVGALKEGTLNIHAVLQSADYAMSSPTATDEALVSQTVYFRDKGGKIYNVRSNGALNQEVGTVNYATGDVLFAAYGLGVVYRKMVKIPETTSFGTASGGSGFGIIGSIPRTTVIEPAQVVFVCSDDTLTINYDFVNEATSEAVTVNPERITGYYIDIVKDDNAVVATEAVNLLLNNTPYWVAYTSVYTGMNASTGTGTVVGSYDQAKARIEFNGGNLSGNNAVTWQSVAQTFDNIPVSSVVFKIPVTPVRPQSFQLLIGTPVQINVTADEDGNIDHQYVKGTVNWQNGTVKLAFVEIKEKVPKAAVYALQAQHSWATTESGVVTQTAEDEYRVKLLKWYAPNEIRYNAVGYSYIPLDAEILGLSATRLPSDGRVPIFRKGDIGIISSSKSQTLDSHVAGQIYPLNDQRISWCELEDSQGKKVKPEYYTVDYDYGRVTLSGDFIMGDLVEPLIAKYRYQDMGLISDVQINGQLTFTKPITHNYSKDDSVVGSALVIGDMQSRYTAKFVQPTWNNAWSDVPSGGSISANYNDALYPIQVSNKGATQERWALVFTDSNSFRIIGETSGQIGTGNTAEDCSPINPVTNAPYFTVKREGWGTGWVNGNVLRFNTVAATYPIWVLRCVKQSEPTVLSDQFQVMLRGDIDRVI